MPMTEQEDRPFWSLARNRVGTDQNAFFAGAGMNIGLALLSLLVREQSEMAVWT